MKLTEREVVEVVEKVTLRRLRFWVRSGWLAPITGEAGTVFDEIDVARVRLLCQLKDELDLSDDAIAVVLSLMDQVYGLRGELRNLAAAVEQQPHDIRREIVRIVRESTGE